MTLLVNSAEGGSNGTTVLTSNSGGASGNAFDAVTTGASAVTAFDNTHALNSLSYKLSTGASSVSSLLQWDASMGTKAQVWFRLYGYFTANPAVNVNLWRGQSGSTLCGGLRLLTTGRLTMLNSAGTQVITTTNSIPLNSFFRIEGFVIGAVSTGQLEVKLFENPNSNAPTETQTSSAAQATNGSMTTYRYGITTGSTNVGPLWLDNLGLSSTGYVGAANFPPTYMVEQAVLASYW